MGIEEIKKHYINYSEWLNSLKSLDDSVWLKPIEPGKWPVASVISHLMFWDRYSLTEKFPFFQEGANLENFPDFQKVNDNASNYALSGVSKEILINELMEERNRYIEYLNQLTDFQLDTTFKIGDHSLTVRDYFSDFMEHDLHHQQQIENVLKYTASK